MKYLFMLLLIIIMSTFVTGCIPQCGPGGPTNVAEELSEGFMN